MCSLTWDFLVNLWLQRYLIAAKKISYTALLSFLCKNASQNSDSSCLSQRLTLDGITTRSHTHLTTDSNCKLTYLSQLPNNRFSLFPHWQNQRSICNYAAMRGQTMAPIIGCLCKAYDGINWYFILQQDGNDVISDGTPNLFHPARKWAHSQSNIMNENFMHPYSPSANYETKSKPCCRLLLLLIHSLHSHT